MSTKKKRNNFIFLAALLVLALILDGCAWRPRPARTADGKTLFRLGFSGKPASLNPYAACDEEAEAVFALLYDTLFSVDAQTQDCVNSLCRSCTVTDSASGVGKLWRLELRDDVVWSDGEKLTAYDVEFSLQSAKDLSTLFGYPFCELVDTTGIAVEDANHLAMIVWGEEAYVRACLARVPILPRHVWNELPCMRYDSSGVAADPSRARREIYSAAADSTTMIGSGLYTWGGIRDGVLTLKLNEAYWNGASRAQVVEFHFGLKDPAEELRAGTIDACWNMSLNDFRAMSEAEELRHTSGTDGTLIQLGFNFRNSRSPVQNAAVRQAAEYCVNRDTLLLYAFGGGYSERGVLSPYSRYYYMKEQLFDRPFDIESASALLQNAGWKDSNGDAVRESGGNKLSMTLLYASDPPAWERAAQILRNCFARAGMELQIRAVSSEEFPRAAAAGDYDLILLSRSTWPDPWRPFVDYYWNGGANAFAQPDGSGGITSLGWNESGYERPEYDRIYEQLTAADGDDLGEQIARAGEYLYNDSASVSIGFAVEYQACSRVWAGIEPYAGSGLYFTPLTLNELFRTMFAGKQ